METITITFTAAAAKEFKRELTNNGIIFGLCGTTYTVENNRKSRMALQMVKERFGSRSIKVNNTIEIVNNF